MNVTEAVQALRRMANALEDNEERYEQHASDELEQFCGEVEDLEGELAQVESQTTDAEQEPDEDEDDE